jgi:hypothetical protein
MIFEFIDQVACPVEYQMETYLHSNEENDGEIELRCLPDVEKSSSEGRYHIEAAFNRVDYYVDYDT